MLLCLVTCHIGARVCWSGHTGLGTLFLSKVVPCAAWTSQHIASLSFALGAVGFSHRCLDTTMRAQSVFAQMSRHHHANALAEMYRMDIVQDVEVTCASCLCIPVMKLGGVLDDRLYKCGGVVPGDALWVKVWLARATDSGLTLYPL